MKKNAMVMNEQIRSATVRLIDDHGNSVVIAISEALTKARDNGLDLVIIAEANPPVCKILDAGRFFYEKKRTEKKAAAKQRASVILTKEIQLRPVTDSHDLDVKTRKAREFLRDGDKVKIVVKFRGREVTHKNKGRDVLNLFISGLEDFKIERPITDGGNNLTMVLASTKLKADIPRKTAA